MITSASTRRKNDRKPAGRRRDTSKHQAILTAARELVVENGYRATSLKGIACRANVSRNVLYNWWDGEINKIIEEALLPNVSEWPIPDTGNFKQDINIFLEQTIEAIHKPHVLKGFLILAAEVLKSPDELTETLHYFRAPYARLVSHILKNAEQRDEIRKGVNPKHLAQIISGSVLQFAISKNPGRRNAKIVLSELVHSYTRLD